MEESTYPGFGTLLFLVVYMLPTIVAACREHKNGMPIAIVNVLLGWTFVAWVIAFAWAYSAGGGKEKNS